MNRDEFFSSLDINLRSDSSVERSCISSAIIRNFSIARANAKLKESLSKIFESIDTSEKDLKDYVLHIRNQIDLLKAADFSKDETPVKTNKLYLLLESLLRIIESDFDSDILSYFSSTSNFDELSQIRELPEHGSERSALGHSKTTISTSFMISSIMHFAHKSLDELNTDSPVVQVYNLNPEREYDHRICFIDSGKILIPHQHFAFGRGGVSKSIKPKDCGSWVQEVIATPEKSSFPLSTADWFAAIPAPRFFRDTYDILAKNNWYETDAGCKFLQSNFSLLEDLSDVRPGDIFVQKIFDEDSSGLKKLISSGHTGIVTSNIRGNSLEVISSSRDSTSTSLGLVDGIGRKIYELDKGYNFFLRASDERSDVISSSIDRKFSSLEDLIHEVEMSSSVYAEDLPTGSNFPVVNIWDLN